MASLLTEKYRPKTIAEYVWQDFRQRSKFEEMVKKGSLPHLLFSGTPGTGKTSLAFVLMNELGIPKGDILFIPASRERKIDEVQDRIVNFCNTWAFNATGIKYVILDEADALSVLSQKFLRTEMEQKERTCRFILTCNYPNKIIEAITSRIQHYSFSAMDRNEFMARAGEILTLENIGFDIDNLIKYCDLTYPDLRRCIGLMDKETVGGVLGPAPAKETLVDAKEYLLDMIDLFKQGKFKQGREVVTANALIEDYPDIYRYFYTNLQLWGSTEDQENDALSVIAQYLVNHGISADPEINLAGCVAALIKIARR
jgi:replication factor C small subunit